MTKPKYRGPLVATVAGEPSVSSRPSTSGAASPVSGSSKSSPDSSLTALLTGRDRPVGDAAEIGERPVQGVMQQFGPRGEHGPDIQCAV